MERLSYKVAEIPALTGLSRTRVYELIATGELPSVRVAGKILVPAEGLKQLIASAPSAAHREAA